MKEITRIHLAATPFNIEIEAKRDLEKYLSAVETSLHADEDALREIEARIVELLAERQVTGEKAVTRADIEAIKQQLGEPGEFVDVQEVEQSAEVASGSSRLFRDEEHGLIGGVLAGVAARFGMNPLWLRIAAIVLMFVSFGTVLLVYVVLWIAIPAAKTAADKLQMAGKPVTLAAIKSQSDLSGYINGAKKPLVVVLRVLLGSCFLVAALMSIVAVGAVVIGVYPMTQDVSNDGSSLIVVAASLAAVSGILFAILMGLASYASFVWRLSRAIIISTVIIVIAGLTSFGLAIGFGHYGSTAQDRYVSSITRTENIDLSTQLQDVTKLISRSETVRVTYEVTNETPRAELTIVSENKTQPKFTVERNGNEAQLTVDKVNPDECNEWLKRCNSPLDVKIYGPALTAIEVKKGYFNYIATNQPELNVITERDAGIAIERGLVGTLVATLGEDSDLSAENASVNEAMVKTSAGVSINFGLLMRLSLDAPTVCPATNAVRVGIVRVDTLLKSDVAVDQQDEIDNGCVEIRIQEPTQK